MTSEKVKTKVPTNALMSIVAALFFGAAGVAAIMLSSGFPKKNNTKSQTTTATTAVIRYVDDSCSNPGDGSTTTCDATDGTGPFRTIQEAADIVNPGDTVIVRNGTYTAAACGQKLIYSSRGGTAEAWVTFKAENKWGAVLDGQSNCATAAWAFYANGAPPDANYIRIEGFEIKGFSSSSIHNDGGGQHLAFVGNNIHDIGRYCHDGANGPSGIFLGSDNVLIEQNLIHDIGRFSPGENGCQPQTTYYQNIDHGVYIGRANNVTIQNNIFYNLRHGWAIHVYNSPIATPMDNLVIANNTFAFPNPYRDGHILFAYSVSNSRVENNIFYQPRNSSIRFYSTSSFIPIYSNLRVRNNMTDQPTISNTSPTGVTVIDNWVNTNPQLVNAAGLDFHLLGGSPAIDAGLPLVELTTDFDGNVRPQGNAHDLGAYEYLASGGGGIEPIEIQ